MGPSLLPLRVLRDTEAEMTTKSHAAMIVARYQLNRRPWNAERAKAVALLDEAIAEEKATELDAERYRWLRDRPGAVEIIHDDGKFSLPDYQGIEFTWRRREWVDGKPVVVCDGLDAAIDKARA